MSILIINIKELLQVRNQDIIKVSGQDMKSLPSIKNAYLLIEDDTIVDFGKMTEIGNFSSNNVIDAKGKYVLPAWCDSHTHIVFAENREQEFVDRINGLSYQEIAANGGGIIHSAKKLQATSEQDLFTQSENRLNQVMNLGTGAIEIKSGYGLTLDAELKMLKVAKKLGEKHPIKVKHYDYSAKHINQSILNSLNYLKTDYLDCLLLHRPSPLMDVSEISDTIKSLLKDGKIKSFGVSNFTVMQMEMFKDLKISYNQINLSLTHLDSMNDGTLEYMQTNNIIKPTYIVVIALKTSRI